MTDRQTADASGMARPAEISAVRTSDSLGLWTTGAYKYDGSGNVWKTGSGLYLYDSLSRVVSGKVYPGAMGTGARSTQTYGYDNYGNLTSTTTNGTLVNTPATTATNRLTAGTYDASGNLTAWSGNAYEYDAFDQMSRHVSSGEDWRYMYTADDERFWAFCVGGGGSVWTLRGLGGEALREYSAHLGWTNYRDNIYRGGTLLATVASAAAGGTTKHLHTDHLGTPRLITDAAGNPATAQFHAYYPYGEELAATYTSAYAERMRFTGHERDLVNLGGQGDDLDYMHERHYGVVTGRFLSVDRALGCFQNPQSWNRYTYGLSNPTRNIDPDGRFSEDTLLGYMNAFVSDFAFGLGRMESESPDFQEGQRLGDEAAQKAGAALAGIGLTTAGLGLVAEVPTLGGSTVAVAGGLATAGYGTAVAGIATHQLMKRTPHDEERYKQARAGDKHREVGDANRVVREGREFLDTKTGNRIFVNGDRVVVVNAKDGSTTRFVNKRNKHSETDQVRALDSRDEMTMKIYKRIDVWARIEDDQVVVYRCFEALPAGGYCVQSRDLFRLPLEKESILMMEESFLDLLVEEDPAERSGIFATIEEAIAQHERKFSS